MKKPSANAMPILSLEQPPGWQTEVGGWFDPFAAGFVCAVQRRSGDVYSRQPDQSGVNFGAAHAALIFAYDGRCVCVSCQRAEVDLTDTDNGLVIAVFNNDDYDYHFATGCGICPHCATDHDLEQRVTKGFRAMLTRAFEEHKAARLN